LAGVPTAAVLNFGFSRDAGVFNVFNWKDLSANEAKLPTKKCVYQDDACTISAKAKMVKDKKVSVTIYSAVGTPATSLDPRVKTFSENEDWKSETETVMRSLIKKANEAHEKRQAELKERQEKTNAETRVRAAESKLAEDAGGEVMTITKDDVGKRDLGRGD
jgi:hypothetical protein